VSGPASGGGLAAKKCVPCEGGTAPLTEAQASALRAELHPDWKLGAGAKSLERALKFKDFYRTMSFVNALAHIANVEDHHPDLEVGYNYCNVTFSTHSIGGLSENDFICAAKLDRLPRA
jgi:4a-hydroxytetrahydrobiopterin dehydratase